MKTQKIVFIGQSAYFINHYIDLPRFATSFLEYTWQVTPNSVLADADDADLRICFRGEYIPTEVTNRWKAHGKTIALSTEPIPYSTEGQLLTSHDRANRFSELLNARGRFSSLYHYDPQSVDYLKQYGFEVTGVFRLPVNLNVLKPESRKAKTWDVFLFGKETPYRQNITNPLKHVLGSRFCHVAHGFVLEDFVRLATRARIAINVHVDSLPATEPRLQLYAACGLMIVSEPLSDDTLWKPYENYVEASGPHDLTEKVLYYLDPAHTQERETIAYRGQQTVHAHLDASQVWPELIRKHLA